MIPFRVLTMDDKGTEYIFQSMYSVNKGTGTTSIFVLQKPFLDMYKDDMQYKKQLAHKLCTKYNSTIVGSYLLDRTENHDAYVLHKIEFSKSGLGVIQYDIDDEILTVFDAMVYAMNDYLVRNDLVITRIL